MGVLQVSLTQLVSDLIFQIESVLLRIGITGRLNERRFFMRRIVIAL